MPLPNGYSFQVPVEREVDALRFFYRFLTCGWLVSPECSAFTDSTAVPAMQPMAFGLSSITFTKDSVGSERGFIAQMNTISPGAIHCVGAFDARDTKRVSAYYMPGSYSVKVVFAQGWRPTEAEVALVESLRFEIADTPRQDQ